MSVISCTEKETSHIAKVNSTSGLVAFWDFQHSANGTWTSYPDDKFPVYIRRIGDDNIYTQSSWPYTDDDSKIHIFNDGPFGHAILFNKGFIYGAVERKAFDQTSLDLRGRQAFTLIAWIKFVGERHMVAGIWDEGGWDKYAGRRQVALFSGLFGQESVIAHISATGAASFPQSTIDGSQYARARAIDGKPFEDDEWVVMATTYDPRNREVRAYLNGELTPYVLKDPVTQSAYLHKETPPANPFSFKLPIFGPRAFTIKYHGFSPQQGIAEHRLLVDLDQGSLQYQQDYIGDSNTHFRVLVDFVRLEKSLLDEPIVLTGDETLPKDLKVIEGDEIRTRLEMQLGSNWQQIGTEIVRLIQVGAPFTFGRALGLGHGSEDMTHGSKLLIDGVAVFDRVLDPKELQALNFN